MKTTYRKPAVTALALAISVALGLTATSTAFAYESPLHVFSVNDVMGGFDGSTFGTGGLTQDTDIICDLGTTDCPEENKPYVDKAGVTLYPTDTEFGFYVVDFLGAEGKVRDGVYQEGYVGDIEDNGVQVGIKISNYPTLKYKAKPPMGTWCQGLGGTSVKCETEHYTTMEHVLSCHEVIPYKNADPVTGDQAELEVGDLYFDCDNAALDDNVIILEDGAQTDRLINPTPCEAENDPVGCQMFPNDKTDMLNNIALSSDYSVQLKDDGKPLYGWGGLHKRPNDVRLYAKLELPAAWKADDAPEAGYKVTKAQLVINHWITNNPNDQLRPEDLENEAATGRKPSYRIEGTPGTDTEVWKSLVACYEGDGDLIDTEEGAVDPTFIGVGTYLRNMPFALDKADFGVADIQPEDPPYAFSSDLYGGFTNAYYTTINRDPFEWSYDANPDPLVQDFVGSPLPDDTLGKLVSGPRWRLKPNKFGQDLPGLEIPKIECSKPPFKSDNIKYEVGTPVTTVINLLDWADENGDGIQNDGPLATSKGWVDVTANEHVTVAGYVDGVPYSTNGLPMTEDFDLAVYVKGDSKSTAIYNAQLVIEYEGDVPPPEPGVVDMGMSLIDVPKTVSGTSREIGVNAQACNAADSEVAAQGTITLFGDAADPAVADVTFTYPFSGVLPNQCTTNPGWTWTAPDSGTSVKWTASVEVTGDLEDDNPLNDTLKKRTLVYPL